MKIECEYKNIIMFVCELLDVNIPEFVFKKDDVLFDINGNIVEFDMSIVNGVKGKYIFDGKILFINVDLHHNDEEYISIVHELRHYYQECEIEDRHFESEETIKLWEHNMNNYVSSNDDHVEYINQPIELDANAFTFIVLANLYSKPIIIRDVDENSLKLRITEILSTITYKEFSDLATKHNIEIVE